MIRPPVLLMTTLALLPALASAQAFKCLDPATGKTLYTDQPCKGGALVVPSRSEEDVRRDAETAAQARQDALRREQAASELELQRQAAQAAQATARARQAPVESEACRAARAEASFRAASFSATEEEIRTARYNAALACGQQPPADIVVVEPYWPAVRHGDDRSRRPAASRSGFGVPVQNTPSRRPGAKDKVDIYPVPGRPLSASSR